MDIRTDTKISRIIFCILNRYAKLYIDSREIYFLQLSYRAGNDDSMSKYGNVERD